MNSKHETNESGHQPAEETAAPRSASPLEAFLDWRFAAAALLGQANIRLFEDFVWSGRRALSSSWTTANKIGLELASMQLRDFSTAIDGTAVLICAPYALHGATIADFAPGHSVVETLRDSGLSRVFVTDWRSATPETRDFAIDNYLADLDVAVDLLAPPVDLIGLCQGGWLAAVYAARFPGKVRRLVLVGAPIDIAAAQSQLSNFVAYVPYRMFEQLVRAGDGILHGDQMLGVWGVSKGLHEMDSVLQNPPNIDPARRSELTERFRRWYGETIDLPGIFYLQVVKWLFKENRIAEGRFIAVGQAVDLKSIRIPIFLLAADNDEIVSAGQLFPMARLVGTPAAYQECMTEPCGHLSLFLGAAVLDGAWRRIGGWLGRDLDEPQLGLSKAVAGTP